MGLISGQRTKILNATCCSQKKKIMLLSKMKISATCYSKKQTNNKNNNKNKHTAEFPEDKIIFASS